VWCYLKVGTFYDWFKWISIYDSSNITVRQKCERTPMKFTKKILWLLDVLFLIPGSALGDNATGYYNSGVDKLEKGDLDGAIADYTKAIELRPDYVKAYNNRGSARIEKGDLDGAIGDFSKAIELKPDHVNSYYGRGNAKERKGDWDGAIADYTKAIETVPDTTNVYLQYAYYGRGNAKERKGDFNGALADYTKAIEIKPDYADAYYARGWVRFPLGDLDGALADYTMEIKINPDAAQAYLDRSRVEQANGDPDGALADYNKAIELKPELAAQPGFAQTRNQTRAPSKNWLTVASSTDGSKLIVGGMSYVYCISTNSGSTWITNDQPQKALGSTYGSWSSVALSADGTKFAGIAANVIWISTNSGSTWFSNEVAGLSFFGSVAWLEDGNKLVAVDRGRIWKSKGQDYSPGFIYMSTNLGANWTRTPAPAMHWTSIASSADGTRLIAAAEGEQVGPIRGGPIYISTNSGVTWKVTDTPQGNQWVSVASSTNGQTLVAVSGAVFGSGHFDYGSIFTSTNFGMTWRLNNVPHAQWQSVASSADGTRLAAVAMEPAGWIYTSTNSGTTWVSINASHKNWHSVALSADGNQLAAVSGGNRPSDSGSIYILRQTR
jgi:tetratricopeptide (TPR) repeat protein